MHGLQYTFLYKYTAHTSGGAKNLATACTTSTRMPGAKESSSICEFLIGALLESQAIPLCTSWALVFKGSTKFDSHICSHTPVATLQHSGQNLIVL